MAVITPAGAILFLPIPIAAFAGKAMPLSIVVAFAVTFVIMNAIFGFSRRIAHAGSFYAFVRASLGIETGFFAGWLMMAFYPVLVALDMILFGATLNGIIVAHGGPNIPWWLLMIIGLAIIWVIGVIGIRFSARSDLVLLTFEIGVLLALALAILVSGAPGGDWHAQVFNPGVAPGGFGGVTLCALSVYALAQVGLVRYFYRNGMFNVLWHLLLPLAALAAIGYLYYKSLARSPAFPNNWAIWIALMWAGAGLAVLAWLKLRHESSLAQTAEIIGGPITRPNSTM